MDFCSKIGRFRFFAERKATLAGQRHFAVFTSPKRKRVNKLRQIHSLALRASIVRRNRIKVVLSSQKTARCLPSRQSLL